MSRNSSAVISGAGPSGLAAAIKLHHLGWKKIYLVERETSLSIVNRGKAFNYQLDGRGQKMLADIGINEDKVREFGVANLVSKFTVYGPNGQPKALTIPFVLEDKQTAYWITRAALIDMLSQQLNSINSDGRIEVLLGHSFERLERTDDGVTSVIAASSGKERLIKADLILGCDGLKSKVRTSLANVPNINSDDFTMVAKPSPSSCLLYKVIILPPAVKVNGAEVEVTDKLRSYIFSSTFKAFDEKLSLFSLPVARDNEQRTANVILPDTHKVWKIDSEDELKRYLVEGFPQLDIDEVFPESEIKSFLEFRPGKFPDPQYSPKVHAAFKHGEFATDVVLIGDAAHSFPPDLGLGVNSALEDMYLFGKTLETMPDDLTAAAQDYETKRLPESRALTRLVRTVFPYQYNHVPWRFKLSLVKILLQMKLHKWTGGLVDEPTFRLSQKETLTYTELERRKKKSDVLFYFIIFAVVAIIVTLMRTIF